MVAGSLRVPTLLIALMLAATVFPMSRDAAAHSPGRTAGTYLARPPLGGGFSLTDHKGRPVTDRDFRGAFMLVYFGYTYCPDLCPTDLQSIAGALDILGEAGKRVRPVFISVDHLRDTVAQLADYVPLFHPRLVGLTGTPRQIRAVTRRYRVHSTVAAYRNDTFVSHSADIFLMGPDGHHLETFRHGISSDKLAAGLRRHLTKAPATDLSSR